MSLATCHSVAEPGSSTLASFSCPSSAAPSTAPARRGELELELVLRHAGKHRLTLRYEILGDTAQSTVLVAGGISANRHVAASDLFTAPGWWDAQVGVGRPLDPRELCILAFDWVGADGLLDAAIDPADQADAIAALLDALDIQRLAGLVGSSYGAMVGLQFAARHGSRLDQLVAISGTHRAHPFSSAWRALQRQAVALGALQCDEAHGLALARQLAILSYRTPEEFAARFDVAQLVNGRVRVGAEDYLDHCSAKFVAHTTPIAFLRLSESIDLQSVAPEEIRVPVTVVAVAEDRLVPIADAHALVERLRGKTRLCIVRSLYGHDAFLKEETAIATILDEAFNAHREHAA